ncbi:M28 family peptidase [Myxococcota bacterium]|nr:M28 family peptidase [Myxococcota bacterium]
MVLLVALLACTDAPAPGTTTDDTGATHADGGTQAASPLPEAIDGARLAAHLDALQAIADAHEDTRLAGLSGYDESVAWATSVLEAAGYAVTVQPFSHRIWQELSPPVLEVEALDGDEGDQVASLQGSPPGEARAPVAAVDLVLPPGAENSSTSGCEASDFDGFPAGHVALIQRGTCTFGEKATLAQAAGAAAVILFNEGQDGRTEVLSGTLGEAEGLEIPVLGASFALGEALAAAGPVQVHLAIDALAEERTVHNLWADLPGEGGEDAGVVVVGAHLDSVAAGPGIHDNGSGTALVLELAVQAAALDLRPFHDLRFALWGAEESGLVGSAFYVDQLDEAQAARHVGNLNFDMVASENGARFVYDGDGSAGLAGWPAPEGSEEIEALFTDWLDDQGLAWQATAFDGRSDYGPFIWAGIPAGGLFTGAEGIKTDAQAETFGGQADAPFDACYHQACDTRDNIDEALFLDMARAAAAATGRLAGGAVLGRVGSARAALARRPGPPEGEGHGCVPAAR